MSEKYFVFLPTEEKIRGALFCIDELVFTEVNEKNKIQRFQRALDQALEALQSGISNQKHMRCYFSCKKDKLWVKKHTDNLDTESHLKMHLNKQKDGSWTPEELYNFHFKQIQKKVHLKLRKLHLN